MTKLVKIQWQVTCYGLDGSVVSGNRPIQAFRPEVKDRNTLGQLLRAAGYLSKGCKVQGYAASPSGAVQVTVSSDYHSIELRPCQDQEKVSSDRKAQQDREAKVRQVLIYLSSQTPNAKFRHTIHKDHAIIEVTTSSKPGGLGLDGSICIQGKVTALVQQVTTTATYRVGLT
jgi:hypothetical protein